jgi:5-methylcytosine-specific restriction endonuclease McrA
MSAMVLVLNASYEPLQVIDWTRAITLLWQDKVEVLEEHDQEIRSVSLTMKIPSVIRMLHMIRTKRRTPVKFTRMNVFSRDGFCCLYCGEKFTAAQLTYDHIVPVAQGGKKSWENIATACMPCNARKEGRTPEQAKMPLLRKPRQPLWAQCVTVTVGLRQTPETWKEYLYCQVELK